MSHHTPHSPPTHPQPSFSSPLLLTPGPVQAHPQLQSLPFPTTLHHREKNFSLIHRDVSERLQELMDAEESPYLLASSGTGAMEAALLQGLFFSFKAKKVLVLSGGKFGERWWEMAKCHGADTVLLSIPPEKSFSFKDLETQLKKHPDTGLCLCQACETSTGSAYPVEEIGCYLREKHPEILFMVDGISALGAYPLSMKKGSMDALIGASHKGFMLSPGLSFVALSRRLLQRQQEKKDPSVQRKGAYYLDLQRFSEVKMEMEMGGEIQDKGKGGNEPPSRSSYREAPFTPPLGLIVLMKKALELMFDQGFSVHYGRVEKQRKLVGFLTKKLGFKLFSHSPSPSITALLPPAIISAEIFRKHLWNQYRILLAGGQGPLKGNLLRISHMGWLSDQDLLRMAEALISSFYEVQNKTIDSQHLKNLYNQCQQYLDGVCSSDKVK